MSKDSTRSIRLDGDVAQIAQKLADDKMLSHTLSKLLRQHYGLNTEIDAVKQQLDRIVNERMEMQKQEKLLADKIDKLEVDFMTRQTTELPILREKLDKLLKTHSKVSAKKWSSPINRDMYQSQLDNLDELITQTSKQIQDLES